MSDDNQDAGLLPETEAQARLLAPGLALAGCVQAYLWRDTTRARRLSLAQRGSWFPATTFAGMSWSLQGEGWEVNERGEHLPLAGRSLLVGPRSRPVLYRSGPEGGQAFFVALNSDALLALTGLDISTLLDRCLDMDALLGPDWQALNRRMLACREAAQCQQVLEDFLRPRWRAHCAAQGLSFPYRDWAQNIALRVAASEGGRSLRQMERRFKRWTGRSQRELRQMQRSEAAFQKMRQAVEQGQLVWSELALDAGYADQAHLCREVKRVTGFSPEELRRRILGEEAFWAYRIWV